MGQAPSHILNCLIAQNFWEHATTPPNADGTDPPRDNTVSTLTSTLDHLRPALEDAAKNALCVGLDDRKFLLEYMLTLMAITSGSDFSKELESIAIDLLYHDLPHPPSAYASLPVNPKVPIPLMTVQYPYRCADGSYYNELLPTLGMVGTPYARTVPNTHPLPSRLLPDAGLVFDTLLKRDKFVPHPGGVSSLFFAFADLVIHSIFNTDPKDNTINNVSSYLDLSPLYGSSVADVDSVRRKDGSGKLWNDVFADRRLLFMPPSACALLVLLNRNHNYIAQTLLKVNENGTYRLPEHLSPEERLVQDEEIFQRSRLVNCAFFMQIILGDYVGAILGLVRDGYSWRLPVLEPIRRLDHSVSPCGEGNVVSVEFNLMYRWHSTISEPDTQWTQQKFHELFPGKDVGKLTQQDFASLYRTFAKLGDVKTWTFAGLKRSQNGTFENAALAKILQDATENSASAFKARGIPEALRVVEIMGIEQGRRWGTCSMNEFRKFMGLKPYASFAEWNPDPSVHLAAEALYHDIDNLELHVGLQAEETKDPMPGAGLCPGYTMSRAILADAVCLTRGDRFMTTEFTPQNLTAWGYQDCQFEKDDGSLGGMLTKLLFRTLPEFYPSGSTYAHFPFMVPEAMKKAMEKNASQAVHEYTWTRPVSDSVPRALDHNALHQRELQERRLAEITGYRSEMVLHSLESLLNDCEFHRWGQRLSEITRELVHENSVNASGATYIDIVRNVLNIAPVRWLMEELAYPLDNATSPSARGSVGNLCWEFSQIAEYIYLNTSPEREMLLRRRAKAAAEPLYTFLKERVEERDTKAPYVASLLQLQTARGYSDGHCESAMLGDVIATVPLFSRATVRILDRILHEPEDLRAQWSKKVPAAEESLKKYVHDALQNDDVGVHHGMMNPSFFCAVVPNVLSSVLTLRHLRPASGQSGDLKCIIEDNSSHFACKAVYLNARGRVSPWPTSMLVEVCTIFTVKSTTPSADTNQYALALSTSKRINN